MEKVGVAVPADLLNKIDRPLEYGDSRSERIRELVQLGLILEDHLSAHGLLSDRMAENNALVREAIQEYVDSDSENS